MQSLRLSTDNEQNLCNLAHCFVGGVLLSPPSRKRQGGGVKVGLMNERIGKSATTIEHLRSSRYWGCRVPHAKHSPRLSVRFTTTGASPTLPIYIVPSAQCRCSFAPRRDPTTEWCFLRCIMLKISRVGSRLAATYQAIVFRLAKSPT